MNGLALRIGLRYHRSRHSNGFISFISASSVLGIMLGVAVLIVGLSVMNGFERALSERFLSLVNHGELEAVEAPLNNVAQAMQVSQRHASVLGAAPYISMQGLLQHQGKMKAVGLKGVDPQAQLSLGGLSQFVEESQWQQLAHSTPAIVLGAGIADELQLKLGDYLTLLVPQQGDTTQLSRPQRVRVKLVGLLNAGGQLDNRLAYLNIDYARELKGWNDGVSGVALRIDEPLDIARVIRELGRQLDQLVYIKTWLREHGYLYHDIQLVRTIMYAIMLLIVAVASFNIISTLILAVSEKRSDIAILKTMGMSDASLISVFVVYGAYNGVLGALLGALLGLVGALSLPTLLQGLEQLLGRSLLEGDIYFVDSIPVELHYTDVLSVSLAALTLSLLATLWPAWQASRVEPAQALGQ